METKANLIWLASYPKSGNTWFRSFLSVLLHDKPLDLNQLQTNGIFASKALVETALDADADYLRPDCVDACQRLAFTHLASTATAPLFVKVHDAYTLSETDAAPRLPVAATRMAMHLVRNPLDVALSLANHLGKSVDHAINRYLTNPRARFGQHRNSSAPQFYQPLGTWAGHAESWRQPLPFPVHTLRYEDLLAQPFATFQSAVVALQLPYADEDIRRAIEATTFDKLRQQEAERGFREKQNPDSRFFHQGKAGRGRQELTPAQIDRITEANEGMMRHFGYL